MSDRADPAPALAEPAALARLAEDCGRDVLPLVLDGFDDEGGAAVAALAAAAEAGDAAGAERALHKLRGSAMTLGLERLVAAIRPLEAEARDGRTPGAEQARRIAALFERSAAAVRALAPGAGDAGGTDRGAASP